MTRSQTLATLYILIAVFTSLQGGLRESMTVYQWIALSIAALIQGLTALRAFLDKTSGEQSASDKMAAAGIAAPGLPPPTPPVLPVIAAPVAPIRF